MILCVLTLLCAFTPALLALQTVPSRLLHGRSYKLAAWSSSGSAIPEGDGFFRIKSLIKRMFGGTPASKSLKEPTVVGEVQKKVVIIGGGVSGLACAKELLDGGEKDFILLEASDAVGGRMRTDYVDGFILDRGFQVFIESYPESRNLFDYDGLDLKPFNPGAYVHFENNFYIVSDPFRRPQDLFASLNSPIGSLIDKVKVGISSILIRFKHIEDIFEENDENTASHLAGTMGVSEDMISRFFAPFYQGIFLSPLELQSSRMFNFVFKMFTEGAASIPKYGIQAVPNQLMAKLPRENVRLNTRVTSFAKGQVQATSGNITIRYACQHVVLASDPLSAGRFLQDNTAFSIPEARSSICLYYGFDGPPPIEEPALILNGENRISSSIQSENIIINNICFPSSVSSSYAPENKSLASVTVVNCPQDIDEATLRARVSAELLSWWGPAVNDWNFLRMYRIPYAQPAQRIPYAIKGKNEVVSDGIQCCGDHRGGATLNGAISSGRRAAKRILDML